MSSSPLGSAVPSDGPVPRSRRELALEQLVEAHDAERERIARELHDETIQALAAALITLDRLGAAVQHSGDPRAVRAAVATRDTIGAALERCRRLLFTLRPALLDAQGIGPTVEALADQMLRRRGLEVSLTAPAMRYPFAVEELVYAIVQDALGLALRPPTAQRVEIAIAERGDALAGEIRLLGGARRPRRGAARRTTAAARAVVAGGGVEVSPAADGLTIAFEVPFERAPAQSAVASAS